MHSCVVGPIVITVLIFCLFLLSTIMYGEYQSINQSLFESGNKTHIARPIRIKVFFKNIQIQSATDKNTIYNEQSTTHKKQFQYF